MNQQLSISSYVQGKAWKYSDGEDTSLSSRFMRGKARIEAIPEGMLSFIVEGNIFYFACTPFKLGTWESRSPFMGWKLRFQEVKLIT